MIKHWPPNVRSNDEAGGSAGDAWNLCCDLSRTGERRLVSAANEILKLLEKQAGEIAESVRKSFIAGARELVVPSGAQIAFENEACARLPFVLSGGLRVYKAAPDGRSITLYDIDPGETCVLTMSCILGGEPFPAGAEALGETRVLVVSSEDWLRWVESSPSLRRYSHQIAARRLSAVIETLSEVAFHRVNQRVARLIVRRSTDSGMQATHQQIADELGTAREVVSRILKEFERNGWIRMSRHEIVLLDKSALVKLAEDADAV